MNKSFFSASMAVAFVWFTTHFGGGFASGRQAVQFYNTFGWYALFTPLIAVGIMAVVFYFSWDLALAKKTYDYRHWANEMYKPYEKIFANLFEIIYNLILLTATAIAFATGGSTLESTIGTPYILNTIIIAICIFFLTIYGADIIRKAASLLGVLIIVGLLVIYGANLIKGMPQIMATLKAAPSPHGFWPALWNAIVYAGFQTAVVGAYVAVSDVLKDRRDVYKASLYGFIINTSMLSLTTIVLLGFFPEVLPETIPILYVLRHGVGAGWMELVISLLILLGVITTGVNLIYGGAKRVVTFWDSRSDSQGDRKKNIIASGIYVIITWAIALLGLIPLVAKGYGYIGYASLFIIVIPVLLRGFFFKNWGKN
ncbi:MAG: hypothetical protein ACOYJ1_13695 [Peptococcales bacterium]|jgi:uncharacterized membrane protein YkvI